MIKKILIRLYESLLRKYTQIKDLIIKGKLGTPKVMSIDETIDYIIEKKCSVSRYGDGEFKIISGENIRFQKFVPKLSERLTEILKGNGEVFVCISDVFDNPKWMTHKAYEYTWRIVAENRRIWTKKLNLKYLYGNAFISRPYLDWNDKTSSLYWFEKLKKIWENQDVVFIEGNKSRLGYGNDLFSNAKSVGRILCPAKNAFEKYENVLQEATKQPKTVLFLLALGPSATVLAEDLAKEGYQAIDIGHIDIEYEWFKKGVTRKVPIANKYTNEAEGGEEVCEYVDDKFKQQIITEIL